MFILLDYKMGNVGSVAKAFQKLGAPIKISHSLQDLREARGIILPGQGAFAPGMYNLTKLNLTTALFQEVIQKRKPFLGICLGLQLITTIGYEDGEHKGLGWIEGSVKKLNIKDDSLKLPHMGWDEIECKSQSVLFKGIEPHPDVYFVHSFHLLCDPSIVTATCTYGYPFTAAIEYRNIFGTQFHPEKSQQTGLKILQNFIDYCSA